MTITNLQDAYFTIRLPIMNCYGHLDISLSKVFPKDNYTYHLYHRNSVPFKFSLKGIPYNAIVDLQFNEKLHSISNIFTENLPIVGIENQESYFRFVKRNSNQNTSVNSDDYKEIESAYP
uniref:hypothetical protein n=1 Tax=Gracilaria usneoides TaxID=172951 RepID=UPI001D12FC89|nr:hypothetical protein LK225_pgp145 [Crassiphycus usneoides]UAD88600.1 hypothetical protein [Crassiphycus usneoides]